MSTFGFSKDSTRSIGNSTPNIAKNIAGTSFRDGTSHQSSSQQKRKLSARVRNVQPKINTGYHLGKLQNDLSTVQQNFRFRSDEIFRRVKLSLLVSLITETLFLKFPVSSDGTVRDSTADEDASEKYLLLDVREEEEYKSGQVVTAEHYPKSRLAQGPHFETKSLRYHKNRDGHVIIIYDHDETIAPVVATTLIQRGIANVFVLSGGLKVALQHFPVSLIINDSATINFRETATALQSQLQQLSLKFSSS